MGVRLINDATALLSMRNSDFDEHNSGYFNKVVA